MANFALLAKLFQRLHGGVEGDGRVGNVELVDVDAIQLEALEAAFDALLRGVWGWRCESTGPGPDALPSALGGDDEAFGVGGRASAISSSVTLGP